MIEQDAVKLNDKFVNTIRNAFPERERLINFLMQKLSLSKESVSRRLRSEIFFTFDEISIISTALEYSIDLMLGKKASNQSSFAMDLFVDIDHYDYFYHKFSAYMELFDNKYSQFGAETWCAGNMMPWLYMLSSEKLYIINYYILRRINKSVLPNMPLSEIEIDQRLLSLLDRWKATIKENRGHYIYLITDRSFSSFFQIIDHYYRINLISNSELQEYKQDLLAMVDLMETTAQSGWFGENTRNTMYYLHLDPKQTYFYGEYQGRESAQIYLYNSLIMKSSQPDVCRMHKQFLERLCKYSTRITESGERCRFELFGRKRKEILALGK